MSAIKPNPMQLAGLGITGALLTACTWLVPLLPFHRVHDPYLGLLKTMWANRLMALALLVPLVAGFGIMLWAEKRLRQGHLNDQWSDADLVRTRALLGSPIWNALSLLFLVGALFVMVTDGPGHNGAFIYLLISPAQSVQRMRKVLAPPGNPVSLTDWRNSKPLRSDHWGKTPRHEQLPS